MAISVGSKRGMVADPNIVPLIDILLVLLVIFMVIPHSRGLRALIPQECKDCPVEVVKPSPIVVQVLADGSLRVNQEPVLWGNLESRLTEVFKVRAGRTVFIWGDPSVEFAVVARVIDAMHTAGIGPVGLLTEKLGDGF